MGFLGFGKKREVPDELPDLISDEIEKESKVNDNFIDKTESDLKAEKIKDLEENRKKIMQETFLIEEKKRKEKENYEEKRRKEKMVDKLIKGVEETPVREEKGINNSDKSFFDELQKNIKKELSELDDLSDFNENNFLKKDFLDDMKGFWEKQKKVSILDSLSREMEEKIVSKISVLKDLEKEWQSVYFNLVEKEENIKEEEKELKKMLKDFSKVCKHKKEAINNEKGKDSKKKAAKKK